MLKNNLLAVIILFVFNVPFVTGQDTLFISESFESWDVEPEYVSSFSINPTEYNFDSLSVYDFRPWKDSLNNKMSTGSNLCIFHFVLKNNLNQNIEVGISSNLILKYTIVFMDSIFQEIETELINIRGRRIHGRVQLAHDESASIFFITEQTDGRKINPETDLGFRIHNFNILFNKELSSRFIHSLLLGLLLFSAVLNLILGLILQRKSHVTLFMYLMSLLLFAFSYLGFYDEFFGNGHVHIPIGLPVYFLTLVLFLQVSKRFLQLDKNLPVWNTITNVIMFFLALSIPYYYLTVYIEKFYINFLAFSSLFFFVIAALMGLIGSIIVLKKEPKAKYFLIANLIVVISLAINIFLENRYPVVVGSVLQGFIFTIGLAEEIKILDKQKLKFQQSLISQLEVNLKLKDDHNLQLEKKVNERTRELKYANNELTEKNNIVGQQKELLEIRSKDIKDSIEYAKRIQTASFPSRKILNIISSDSFIFYKPRDIVSGDFYWFGEVDDKIIIIASDCTGHGVPGAFMSMYGIAFLNEIVNKQKIFEPNKILNTLREKIASSLNRGDDEFETMDGMDMSVLTFDKKNNQVFYSGAFSSLYLIRSEELQIIQGDKMPVAYYQQMDDFTLHEIELIKGDCFYIFTDGLIDQFGGQKGKKFLAKRLKDILMDISHLSMQEQYFQIDQAFTEWKGNYFQVDDVLMIGLRY